MTFIGFFLIIIMVFGGYQMMKMSLNAFFIVRSEQPETFGQRVDKQLEMFGLTGFFLLGLFGIGSSVLIIIISIIGAFQ